MTEVVWGRVLEFPRREKRDREPVASSRDSPLNIAYRGYRLRMDIYHFRNQCFFPLLFVDSKSSSRRDGPLGISLADSSWIIARLMLSRDRSPIALHLLYFNFDVLMSVSLFPARWYSIMMKVNGNFVSSLLLLAASSRIYHSSQRAIAQVLPWLRGSKARSS